MALYAIGDFHLSLGTNKPMNIFGPAWQRHEERLQENFAELCANDVCVICGDLSWAISLAEAKEDFLFIDKLPGKKIILKGNHDYWFSTASKVKAAFAEWGVTSIEILHNNCYFYNDDIAICGTRGWFYEAEKGTGLDKKIMAREVGRLETSLKLAGEREKYVFLHYPPKYNQYECTEILELLEKYEAKICASGHIHGHGLRFIYEGMWQKTQHYMVAGDFLGFKPKKICD